MADVRAQYHSRKSGDDVLIWDVRRLIDLSKDLPVLQVDPTAFAELHENHWHFSDEQPATPSVILGHVALIESCDLSCPIILASDGRVMDGMHRICKAVKDGVTTIPAVQFTADPQPDYVNADPKELPYD